MTTQVDKFVQIAFKEINKLITDKKVLENEQVRIRSISSDAPIITNSHSWIYLISKNQKKGHTITKENVRNIKSKIKSLNKEDENKIKYICVFDIDESRFDEVNYIKAMVYLIKINNNLVSEWDVNRSMAYPISSNDTNNLLSFYDKIDSPPYETDDINRMNGYAPLYSSLISRSFQSFIYMLVYAEVVNNIKIAVNEEMFEKPIQEFKNIIADNKDRVILAINNFINKYNSDDINTVKGVIQEFIRNEKEYKDKYRDDYFKDNYMKIIQNRNVLIKRVTSGKEIEYEETDSEGKIIKNPLKLYLNNSEINKTLRNIKTAYKDIFEYNLNFEDFRYVYQISNNKCSYCGLTEEHIIQLKKDEVIKTIRFHRGDKMEIDRMDPKKGYIKGNIALSCYWCNNAKSDEWDAEEFIDIAQGITAYWNKYLDGNITPIDKDYIKNLKEMQLKF